MRGPFDFLAQAWSRKSRVKARRGNRKAFWWISNLWYKPAHLLRAIGGVVVVLLVVSSGLVSASFCVAHVGCASTRDGGIAAVPASTRATP